MYPSSCPKCGGTAFHTQPKGNNTGLYCTGCGSWIKWLSKADLKAFQLHQSDLVLRPKSASRDMISRLRRYVNVLNDKVDAEYSKLPLSPEDAIRKNSYCQALQQSIVALSNVLDGREWNEDV